MRIKKILGIVSLTLALSATGCIDKNYDLDNIDTTVQVKVDNLVVPINIDQIFLKSILKETDEIKVIDGAYCYVTDGTFDSDDIKIHSIEVEANDIKPDYFSLQLISGTPIPGIDFTYEVTDETASAIEFHADDIDKTVHSIKEVYADVNFKLTLNTTAFSDIATHIDMTGIKMVLPRNLTIEKSNRAGTYYPETGIFDLDDFSAPTNTDTSLELLFSSLKVRDEWFDGETHKIDVKEKIGLVQGLFTIPSSAFIEGAVIPSEILGMITYDVANFSVKAFSGEIQYEIEDVDIPTVELNDLPDFLAQEGTNLIFTNPQLYLHTNNPLSQYGLYATTGLEITANRNDRPSVTYAVDQPFTIGKNKSTPDGDFNFCIAPYKPEQYDAQYPNPQFVKFSDLGRVLSGDGLPNSLDVNLVDPQIPLQAVDKFLLGVSYPGIDGRYRFVAPFQLDEGSAIIYSDKFADWWSEDMDYLTIERIEINAEISTDIPVSVKVTGYPLDKNGTRIQGASIEGAEIPRGATDQPLCIRIAMPQGGLTGIGGMEFTATASATGGEALSPDMWIKISKLRPCVSGYYQKEL